ncbi:hypothetical protein LTR62_003722 [Meristemomyces frigidus]|uniref:CENP-V/GFA domain-containing protein n=1 Tax=Meristemomyces frigidus TaxID=1508187 RepID=A0AAN7TJC3_9PEZI|nr:hypothetical protein LTR62_003722 [Meristemomyces frigidus]
MSAYLSRLIRIQPTLNPRITPFTSAIRRQSTMSSPPTVTKTATCLCGSVSFTSTGVDKGSVLCHCSNCQKFGGGPFMHNTRLIQAENKFTRGEEILKKYEDRDTKNGNVLERYFCGNCGSPMMFKSPNTPGLVVLQSGTLQEQQQPRFELYGENRHGWIPDLTAKKAKM